MLSGDEAIGQTATVVNDNESQGATETMPSKEGKNSTECPVAVLTTANIPTNLLKTGAREDGPEPTTFSNQSPSPNMNLVLEVRGFLEIIDSFGNVGLLDKLRKSSDVRYLSKDLVRQRSESAGPKKTPFTKESIKDIVTSKTEKKYSKVKTPENKEGDFATVRLLKTKEAVAVPKKQISSDHPNNSLTEHRPSSKTIQAAKGRTELPETAPQSKTDAAKFGNKAVQNNSTLAKSTKIALRTSRIDSETPASPLKKENKPSVSQSKILTSKHSDPSVGNKVKEPSDSKTGQNDAKATELHETKKVDPVEPIKINYKIEQHEKQEENEKNVDTSKSKNLKPINLVNQIKQTSKEMTKTNYTSQKKSGYMSKNLILPKKSTASDSTSTPDAMKKSDSSKPRPDITTKIGIEKKNTFPLEKKIQNQKPFITKGPLYPPTKKPELKYSKTEPFPSVPLLVFPKKVLDQYVAKLKYPSVIRSKKEAPKQPPAKTKQNVNGKSLNNLDKSENLLRKTKKPGPATKSKVPKKLGNRKSKSLEKGKKKSKEGITTMRSVKKLPSKIMQKGTVKKKTSNLSPFLPKSDTTKNDKKKEQNKKAIPQRILQTSPKAGPIQTIQKKNTIKSEEKIYSTTKGNDIADKIDVPNKANDVDEHRAITPLMIEKPPRVQKDSINQKEGDYTPSVEPPELNTNSNSNVQMAKKEIPKIALRSILKAPKQTDKKNAQAEWKIESHVTESDAVTSVLEKQDGWYVPRLFSLAECCTATDSHQCTSRVLLDNKLELKTIRAPVVELTSLLKSNIYSSPNQKNTMKSPMFKCSVGAFNLGTSCCIYDALGH